ncbi:MAG: DnaJ domain-containing protein [Acidobacteriota bacterium]|nr:DnaJ domain-containing protein [Acidobacteriota bacterium]
MEHIAIFLKDIFFQAKSGRLAVKRKDIEKYIFFIKGKPYQVKTNVKSERLGEILFKLQKIQQDAFTRIDDYIEANQPLGESLKKGGVIKEADVKEGLAFQIREVLLNVFNYFDAELFFQVRQDLKPPAELAVVDVPFIINHGIRQMKYDESLEKLFLGKKVMLKNSDYVHLLADEEKNLLQRFSKGQEINRKSAPPGFSTENFFRCLYLFYCLNMVELLASEVTSRDEDLEAKKDKKDEISEIEQRLEELREIKASLKTKNFYELLGVNQTATEEEVKRAYFNLARKYHPDRFNHQAEDISLINEVFNSITNAYRILIDSQKRKQYDTQLTKVGQEAAEDQAKKAEIKYRQARTLFNQGMYEEAIIFLEEALRLRRGKADYFLLLAMAESKLDAYKKKAEQDFLQAIELQPWKADGYLGLGLLYMNEGLKIKARKQLERALEIDPESQQTRALLTELEQKEKKTGLKSILDLDFSDLFKKKK